MVFGALPLIAVALLVHSPAPQWAAAFVAALAYTLLLANILAWVLWPYALRALSAGAAGLGTLAVPASVCSRPGCSSGSGPAQSRPPAWS